MVHVVEYVIFGIVVGGNLALGLYFSFHKARPGIPSVATTAEVFLGNRALRMLPLAASSVASVCSSTSLVAFPAHFYAYGMHIFWCCLTPLLYLPLATRLVVPVVYKLRVTSIFEYLRLRFNTTISLTACVIYIFLTQSIGAISIFAASLTLVTVFKAPLLWCNISIGLCGTFYTALGGLRGVVWTDCVQLVAILIAPLTVIAKIAVESSSPTSTIQPLEDFKIKDYIANFSLDLTSDENVWSCLLGASATAVYRLCFDQVLVQRQLACRTLKEAKRATLAGTFVLFGVQALLTAMGFALVIWFRGCDPGLLGHIKSIDQILPYYINKYLVDLPGLSGLFLAGVVCAATSTVSSTINSQAAVLYVDVIAPRYKNAEKHVVWITRMTAIAIGLVMTVYSTIFVYLGSLTKAFMMANTAATAPFTGLCLLAVLFPFVHSKGAGIATLLVTAYQIYHLVQTIASETNPPRMPVSLQYCPANFSRSVLATNESCRQFTTGPSESFFILRLSYYWSSFFALFATILAGILLSALTGEMRSEAAKPHLCSDVILRMLGKHRQPLGIATNEEITEINPKQRKLACQPENKNLLAQEFETCA
ncbi:sodium-coupled monocarboxylate transporter 2-like [Haemaphysalis longicornis]